MRKMLCFFPLSQDQHISVEECICYTATALEEKMNTLLENYCLKKNHLKGGKDYLIHSSFDKKNLLKNSPCDFVCGLQLTVLWRSNIFVPQGQKTQIDIIHEMRVEFFVISYFFS